MCLQPPPGAARSSKPELKRARPGWDRARPSLSGHAPASRWRAQPPGFLRPPSKRTKSPPRAAISSARFARPAAVRSFLVGISAIGIRAAALYERLRVAVAIVRIIDITLRCPFVARTVAGAIVNAHITRECCRLRFSARDLGINGIRARARFRLRPMILRREYRDGRDRRKENPPVAHTGTVTRRGVNEERGALKCLS